MLFTLKKFVSWFLDPTNICLLLIAPGIVLLWTKKYLRHGRILVTCGLAVLAVFSNGAVARCLVLSLESRYAPIPDFTADTIPPQLKPARYISVLGGGGGDTPGFSSNNKLSRAALSRLIEGVRLARLLPQAKLIVSGAAGNPGEASNAELYQRVATQFGIDESRIVLCREAKDTMDEAAAIKAIVGSAPYIQVTSAAHLPRAMALMRHAGLNPIPAPADYLDRPVKPWRFQEQLWGPGALESSSAVLHEYIGMVWGTLRGGI